LMAASAAAVASCSQIIGADKDREPAQRVIREDITVKPTPVPVKTCAAGEKTCGGACVSINDPAFGCAPEGCGRCSVPFAASVKCEAGKCAVATCSPGRADCNGSGADGCEADLSEASTCRDCKVACGGGVPYCDGLVGCVDACTVGKTLCGNTCADVTTNAKHCGACNNACPLRANSAPSCALSKCTITCNKGFEDCDKSEATGCEPLKPYFNDKDGDGFGAGAVAGEACLPPAGASAVATDCHDGNKNVKPGQTAFFATGYTAASGALSYDYDCSGFEEGEPGKVTATCNPCRPGVGQQFPTRPNPFCGSTVALSCGSSGCVTGSGTPYQCH
jgi:hypothetical protein